MTTQAEPKKRPAKDVSTPAPPKVRKVIRDGVDYVITSREQLFRSLEKQ